MEIIRGLHNIRERHRGCVATIGTFDGIHLGHQRMLTLMQEEAQRRNTKSLLVTFEPQPREFFRGSLVPARLTRFREKIAIMQSLDIDFVLCVPFNERTSSTEADTVIEQFLVRLLAIKLLIVGDDFRFGRNAEGDYSKLASAGKKFHFDVTQLSTSSHDGERISSTRIREALAAGDLDLARSLLGRLYFMMGTVVEGQRMGQSLGVPTANIRLQRYRSAIEGIFAVKVAGLEKEYLGSAYVGTRPTLQGTLPLLEVHIFDFSGNIYGARLKVTFLRKFREDEKFDGLEALKHQMFKDLEEIRSWFEQNRETTVA